MKAIILILIGAVLAASQIAPEYTPLQCHLHGAKLCSNNYITKCVAPNEPCPAGSYSVPTPSGISCTGVGPYGVCESPLCGANCQCEQSLHPFVKCYEPRSDYTHPFVIFGYNNTGTVPVAVPIDSCYNGVNPGDIFQGQPTVFPAGVNNYSFAVPADVYPVCWRLGDEIACFNPLIPNGIPLCSALACNHPTCETCTEDPSNLCNWCGLPGSPDPALNGVCFPSISFPELTCELGTSDPAVCPLLVNGGVECAIHSNCSTCTMDPQCDWCWSTCSCKNAEFIDVTCPEASVPGVVVTVPGDCPIELINCDLVDPQAAFHEFYLSTNGPSWSNNFGWNNPAARFCDYYGVDCARGVINLSNNNLNGVIPPNFFCALSNFSTIYLQNNNLEGLIPNTIGNLNAVKYLDLHGNTLTGPIPSTINGINDTIQYLYLQDNCLSCEIPESMGLWAFLKELHLEGNSFTGVIPPTFYTTFPGDERQLYEVHFECNEIPADVTSTLAIEALRTLVNVRFSGKYQTGPEDIPYVDLAGTNQNCAWAHPDKCPVLI